MFAQDDPVKLAIDAKQAERDQIIDEINKLESELETKRTRLVWLDAFIEKGCLLLGVEVRPKETDRPPLPPDSISQQGPELSPPIEMNQVDGAREILKEFGRPMKAREIAEQFYKRNWKLSKDNGVQIIRQNVLNKNSNVFKKLEDGSFGLIEQK